MFVLGTAGHVDHGKSSLLRRLTEMEPDRLPEEKTRGMTIDLNFVWLTTSKQQKIGILDVPGHQRFVKNMISGTMNVDAFLFVVAADDSWMPQSEEHLQVLRALGIRRGIGIVTKVDLVAPDRAATVEALMRERFRTVMGNEISVLPFSAMDPNCVPPIREAVELLVAQIPAPRDIGRPRLWIDRVFTPKGQGVVVTGTLREGSLREGDAIQILPGPYCGIVKGLQRYREPTKLAAPVSRVAIHLSKISRNEVGRGSLLVGIDSAVEVATIDAQLNVFDRLAAKNISVMFHIGTTQVAALLIALEKSPTASRLVRLKLKSALPLRVHDRFILRTPGEEKSLAAGIILDARIEKSTHREALLNLKLVPDSGGGLEGFLEFELTKRRCVRVTELIQYGPYSEGEVNRALKANPAYSEIDSGVYARKADWEAWQWQSTCPERLPEKLFVGRLGLPTVTGKKVLAALVKKGLFIWSNGEVRSAAAPYLDPQTIAFRDWLTQQFNVQKTIPISLKSNSLGPDKKKILAQLTMDQAVIGLGEEFYLSKNDFEFWQNKIYVKLKEIGQATTSELREFLGVSRKHAVLILERLDRERMTYLKDGVRRLLKG